MTACCSFIFNRQILKWCRSSYLTLIEKMTNHSFEIQKITKKKRFSSENLDLFVCVNGNLTSSLLPRALCLLRDQWEYTVRACKQKAVGLEHESAALPLYTGPDKTWPLQAASNFLTVVSAEA